MPTVRVEGNPAARPASGSSGTPPPNALPGNAGFAAIGQDATVGGSLARANPSNATGFDLALNHQRNQQITSAGVSGGGGGFFGGGGGGSTGGGGGFGAGPGGNNPLGMAPGGVQFGSAIYYLRAISNAPGITTPNGPAGGFYPGGAFTGGFWRGGGGGGNPPPNGGAGWNGPPNFGPGMPWNPGGVPGGGGNNPGGGGGGGGGGGWWGGGGHGGGHFPFAANFGLGHTGNALARAGRFGAAGAVFAGAVEEGFFLPQNAGRLAMGALGSATPYNDIALRSAAIGRTGGFSGQRLAAGLGAEEEPGGAPPKWMQDAGLGPTEALRLLDRFGITPKSNLQSIDILQGLSRLPFDYSALSSLPEGMAQNSAGQAARMGLISSDKSGIQAFGNIISAPLARAVEQGVDSAQVLRSIDNSMAIAAQSGGSVGGIANVAGFLERFMSLPGRTQAGEHAAAGVSSALSSVGDNPARTVAMSEWTNKLRSEGDLKNLFDSTNGPGSWAEYTKDPANRRLADRYLRFRGQNSYFAIQTLSELVNSPGGASVGARMFSQNAVANQYGNKDISDIVGARLSGMGQREYDAISGGLSGPSMPTSGPAGTQANNPLNLGYAGQASAIGKRSVTSGPDIAVFPNVATGIAASVNQLRMYQQKSGMMTPRQLAMRWSGGNASDAYINNVASKMGVPPDTPVDVNDPYAARGFVQGAQPYETGPTRVSNMDINTGVNMAFGLPNGSADYQQTGAGRVNQADMGDNDKILSTISQAKTAGISGSRMSSQEMGIVLPPALNALSTVSDTLSSAVANFANAVRSISSGLSSSTTNALPTQ